MRDDVKGALGAALLFLLVLLCFCFSGLLAPVDAQTVVVKRVPVVSWQAPTSNVDGSELDDLGGYELVVTAEGNSPDAQPASSVRVEARYTQYQGPELWAGLAPGRYQVHVRAFDLVGNLSDFAPPALVDTTDKPPAPPTLVTVQVKVVTEVTP